MDKIAEKCIYQFLEMKVDIDKDDNPVTLSGVLSYSVYFLRLLFRQTSDLDRHTHHPMPGGFIINIWCRGTVHM
jgi:hypothetical protein